MSVLNYSLLMLISFFIVGNSFAEVSIFKKFVNIGFGDYHCRYLKASVANLSERLKVTGQILLLKCTPDFNWVDDIAVEFKVGNEALICLGDVSNGDSKFREISTHLPTGKDLHQLFEPISILGFEYRGLRTDKEGDKDIITLGVPECMFNTLDSYISDLEHSDKDKREDAFNHLVGLGAKAGDALAKSALKGNDLAEKALIKIGAEISPYVAKYLITYHRNNPYVFNEKMKHILLKLGPHTDLAMDHLKEDMF